MLLILRAPFVVCKTRKIIKISRLKSKSNIFFFHFTWWTDLYSIFTNKNSATFIGYHFQFLNIIIRIIKPFDVTTNTQLIEKHFEIVSKFDESKTLLKFSYANSLLAANKFEYVHLLKKKNYYPSTSMSFYRGVFLLCQSFEGQLETLKKDRICVYRATLHCWPVNKS